MIIYLNKIMEEKEVNKNEIDKEISLKSNNLKVKIFDYFYALINVKNKTSKITLCLLYIFEIIQIISFAFYQPHLDTWKMSSKKMELFSIVTSIFRLIPILDFTNYNAYIITFIVFIIFIFGFCLSIVMQILFRKDNSKLYNGLLSITYILIPIITIFLYIPINELLLITFKCSNNKIEFKNSVYAIKCWGGIHILYSILSVIAILLNLACTIFLNFFFFYPFQTDTSTIKLDSSLDIILLIIKFIYVLRLTFIKNEYLSITILLILSIFLCFKSFNNPTYNYNILEKIINIKNYLIAWTFFMLFVTKLLEETEINNNIYLVFVGYPIIIYFSIMLSNTNKNEIIYKDSSLHNINSCLSITRFLIKLINNFIEKNVNLKNYDSSNKFDLVLKGIIDIHTEKCFDEECPLTKFVKNRGNLNVQKQCLLSYMTLYFNRALKVFPYNKLLRIYYIQFNYMNKFNLNSVRANLEYIKKLENNIEEEFIIFCLENEIIKMKNKALNSNDGNESEEDNVILEQNYKRFKDLITNSTKLYVEFWAIFANNITNNLNTLKLYNIGEKLNIYLNEINFIWENHLMNKKLDIENEYIVQLYSKFLVEILWDKAKSEEVQKKINEEYYTKGFKKTINEDQKTDNIDNLIESQDYLLFANSNEKGKCTIFQISNSFTYLIGYQKQELINKPIEVLMPSIFIEGHAKKVEEFIKSTHINANFDKEELHEEEKRKIFLTAKSKMGYLVPFNSKFTIFDDNDFSNNFIIKANLELADAKSLYAYYILAKPDFSVDNFSSSAIHLGLTMDLLKKYVIKLNILVRSGKGDTLNLFEKYKTFIDEPKRITWVYPDIIYPKDDNLKIRNKNNKDLIRNSLKKRFNLQIREMKYKEGEIIGYILKFTEIKRKKSNKKVINPLVLMPPKKKNEIIFDLMDLRYIRTILVKAKSGLHNLRSNEEETDSKDGQKTKIIDKKRKKSKNEVVEEESSEEENQMILTKDRILELQTRDSAGIRGFVDVLPFFGEDISLVKHRPNKELYHVGIMHEPIIKINLNEFCKRTEKKIKMNPNLLKRIKNGQNEKKGNEEKNEDTEVKQNFISSIVKENENENKEKDEINKDIFGDSSINLSNIFNENSINKIKLVDFIIYIVVILISCVEFIFNYKYISSNKGEFSYLDNSYKMLNNIVYIKYFVDETVIVNTLPNYLISQKIGETNYINQLKNELSGRSEDFNEAYSSFTNKNKISKKLSEFLGQNNITLWTLRNGLPLTEEQPFNLAMNKLSTAIFYIAGASDFKIINMNNMYTFELMFNLLNGYYSNCMNIYLILLDDLNESKKNPLLLGKLIIVISLIVSCLCIFSFYKVMIIFVHDREKPINLFFTIKKNVFEDLKNSAEVFSNKLLNKFFGNEENEEESQIEYRSNIKPNDINIAKFKALNEYKKSINKGGSIMFYLGLLITFFIIYELYIIFKYVKTNSYFLEVSKFTDVYNVTQICNNYILLRANMIKQYMFNETLSNYRLGKRIKFTLKSVFTNMAGPFSKTLFITTNTDSFLKNDYKKLFRQYVYNDFSDFIDAEYTKTIPDYNYKIINGIKPIEIELFEKYRYLVVKYYLDPKRNEDKVSEILNDEKWYEVNEIIINYIRPWYKNIIKVLNSCFFSLVDNLLIIYISIFILLIILVTLAYCIIWKSYEEKFHILLKSSFDLINLIPKEIKYIIASKLNE